MASALADKFGGKKRPPKFGDEGEPSSEDSARGSGGTSGGAAPEPDMDDKGGPPDSDADDMGAGGPDASMDPEQMAVDDMADILGVGPEDRQDFANALKTYVSTCIANNMAPPDMGGGMPGAGAADMGGPDEGP